VIETAPFPWTSTLQASINCYFLSPSQCSSIRRKDQDSAQQTAKPANFNDPQAVRIRLIPQPSEDRRHAPGVMWQPDLGMRGHSNSEEPGSSSQAEAAGADNQVLANTAHSR